MRRLLYAGIAIAVGVSASSAYAADDPITVRKRLMDANGAAAGMMVAMIKGDMPFAAGAADSALKTFNAVAHAYGDFFPAGSDQGDTKASPEIWQDMAGFQEKLADFQQAVNDAMAMKPASVDDVKTAMGGIGKACGGCHEVYRLSNN